MLLESVGLAYFQRTIFVHESITGLILAPHVILLLLAGMVHAHKSQESCRTHPPGKRLFDVINEHSDARS
jgi:hypothetical protein